MNKTFWNLLLISPAILGLSSVACAGAIATEAPATAEANQLATAVPSESQVAEPVAAAPATPEEIALNSSDSIATTIEATPTSDSAAIAPASGATATEAEKLAAIEPDTSAPALQATGSDIKPSVESAPALPATATAPLAAANTAEPSPQTSDLAVQSSQTQTSETTQLPTAASTPATKVEVAQTAPTGMGGPIVPAAPQSQPTQQSGTMSQVTSVSQLSDVQPTDWAFQALQSLVERYGCIAGYPDGTYRGNRAMTRYEFAAGLNACLDKVNELIRAGTGNLATKEDLAALQRLQEEFAAELATLRGRVDALEARTSELEANQFSTTTKLTGEAIFALSDDFSGDTRLFDRDRRRIGSNNNEAVFQQRVRLNLNTSFTGRDLLLTRLQVGNGQNFNVGATSEGTQTWNIVGNPDNVFRLDTLLYKFPLSARTNVTIAANAGVWDDIIPTVNPYFEDFDGGNGSLSAFGQRNPIYRLGGGAGIGFDYAFGGRGLLGGVFGPTSFSFGYLASNAANPSKGAGLFNGDYAAMGQLTFTPGRNLQVALNYNHGYFNKGNFGFDNGLVNGPDKLGGFTGTGIANSINGLTEGPNARKVVSNSYGAQASIRLSPRFIIGGWAGLTNARIIGTGDARIWNYAATLALPDLGKEGNLLGFVVGREPYLDKLETARSLRGFRNDPSWHFEGFYKFKLTDNISVTPGVIWITNPNQNDDNDDIIIGTLRTTFTF